MQVKRLKKGNNVVFFLVFPKKENVKTFDYFITLLISKVNHFLESPIFIMEFKTDAIFFVLQTENTFPLSSLHSLLNYTDYEILFEIF